MADPMPSGGFIKIHRAIAEHPVFRGVVEKWAFVELIMMASWKPTTVRYKDRIINLDRGQCAISYRDFAGKIDGWDVPKVQRFFKRLKNQYMIRTQNDTGVTVLTICNYSKYQDDTREADTPNDTPTDTGPIQDRYTEQEGKELKEDKKDISTKVDSPKPNGFDPSPFVEKWNCVCGQAGLPVVRKLYGSRRAKAIKRWREDFGASVAQWGSYCEKIAGNDFLTGQNDRGWRASFDWSLEPRALTRVMEGSYGKAPSASNVADIDIERKLREMGFD